MTGKIVSVQVGMPQKLGGADGAGNTLAPWESGIYKSAVAGPVRAGKTGLAGDGQAFEEHGGPDKAVFAFAVENLEHWARELALGAVVHGAQGENLTTSGLLESSVCIGDIFTAGEVRLQVTQPRQPCWKIARRNDNRRELPALMEKTGRSGWYFRGVVEGYLEAGMDLILAERPAPSWSVERAFLTLRDLPATAAAARELMQVPALSQRWKESLRRGLEQGQAGDPAHRLYDTP